MLKFLSLQGWMVEVGAGICLLLAGWFLWSVKEVTEHQEAQAAPVYTQWRVRKFLDFHL